MKTSTAGSLTTGHTNPTMSPFYSPHDVGAESAEDLNPSRGPIHPSSDVHEGIRPYTPELPTYTRRPENGENQLLEAGSNTNQSPIHRSTSNTLSSVISRSSFPIEKSPTRAKSVQILGHQPGLKRGIQIPTRLSYITSGFPIPQALMEAGVEESRWKQFTAEAKSYGAMSGSQWAATIGGGFGTYLSA